MNTPGHDQTPDIPAGRLTDDELDAALDAAQDELQEYVGRHADQTAPLLAIMRAEETAHAPRTETSVKLLTLRIATTTLAHDLARVRGRAHHAHDVLNRVGRDYTPARAEDVSRMGLKLRQDLDRARYRVRELGLPDLALARDLAASLTLARDRARDLTRGRDLARNCDLARELVRIVDGAAQYAQTLATGLREVTVDASGANLTGLPADDPDVFEGVIWNRATTWPPELHESIESHSEEIRPGVFQVRGGSERDPHDASFT